MARRNSFLRRDSNCIYLSSSTHTPSATVYSNADEVGIELGNVQSDYEPPKAPSANPDPPASGAVSAADEVTFFDRFKCILEDVFDDNKSWWEAAEKFVKKDSEVAASVARKTQERGDKYRRQSIVEVIVETRLAMEKVSLSKALALTLSEKSISQFPKKLFSKELLRRGADPNAEVGNFGQSPLHLAAAQGLVSVVKLMLKKKAQKDKKDNIGETPLVKAVFHEHVEVTRVLIEAGANIDASDSDEVPCFHLAAHSFKADLIKLFLDSHVYVDDTDFNGRTPLHHAAYYGSTDAMTALLVAGASVNARDVKKRTALHIVAKDNQKENATLLLDHGADSGALDYEGCTALDVAASREDAVFEVLVSHSSITSPHDRNHLELIKKSLGMKSQTVKDDFIAARLKEMSPMAVVDMVKPTALCGDGTFNFIDDFIKAKGLRKSTKAVMDHFVLGKRRVNCEILDADSKGFPPNHKSFNPTSTSLLDAIVETDNQELANHPAVQAIVEHKWDSFVGRKFVYSFGVYLLRTFLLAFALFMAARPDLDNPGCYRIKQDIGRGVLEGLTLILFVLKGLDEFSELIQSRKEYIKDYYNWLQVLAIAMPFTIIPFRVATTWCASTGVGYCALPVINSTDINSTDINVSCIVASHVQWIFAALAYLFNAILILDYLALFEVTGVYVRILIQIVKSDILKLSILYMVFLFFFVGSFYFALRAGVTITSDGQIISDASRFQLETLNPWNVLFTGIRILVESQGIIDGYFANDDSDVYVGYQWFSVAMYMLFLFVVIVVLLNLLIAQMSDSYTKVQKDAEGTFAMANLRTVARLQKGRLYGTNLRRQYYVQHLWLDIHEEERTREQENTATINTLSERVDKLSKMTEVLVEELMREKEAKEVELLDDLLAEETLDKLDQLPDIGELSDLDISDDDDDDEPDGGSHGGDESDDGDDTESDDGLLGGGDGD